MEDTYYEQMVTDDRKGRCRLFRFLMIFGSILVCGLVFISPIRQYAFVLVLIICTTAVMFLWRRCAREYEYIFTDGQLDIDLIFDKRARKHLATIQCREITICVPPTDEKFKQYKDRKYSVNITATDGSDDESTQYLLIASKNDRTLKLIFQPDDTIIGLMKKYAPRTVVKRKFY